MNKFKPSLESLEPRWTPDGPRPLGLDGLPLPVQPVPSGSPVVTIVVTTVVLTAGQVAPPQ